MKEVITRDPSMTEGEQARQVAAERGISVKAARKLLKPAPLGAEEQARRERERVEGAARRAARAEAAWKEAEEIVMASGLPVERSPISRSLYVRMAYGLVRISDHQLDAVRNGRHVVSRTDRYADNIVVETAADVQTVRNLLCEAEDAA